MGLIRKSLYLGSGGVVAPHSKKQRRQMQQLAALQGATPEQVRRVGGRYDYDSFLGLTPSFGNVQPTAPRQPIRDFRPCAACGAPVRQVAGRYWDERNDEHQCPGRRSALVRMYCGHTVKVTDPATLRWIAFEDGDLSYNCVQCGGEQVIVAVDDATDARPAIVDSHSQVPLPPDTAVALPDPDAGPVGKLADELERLAALHTSGALTDAEFQAAKARLLGL